MSPADDQPDLCVPPPDGTEVRPPVDPEAFGAAVEVGLAELDAGHEIPAEDVWRWVASWERTLKRRRPSLDARDLRAARAA